MSGGPGSGIQVADDCITQYNDLQNKKTKKRCIIYKISDDNKEVVIEKTVDKGGEEGYDKEDFENIVSSLADAEPRYVVIDMKGPPAKEGAAENDRIVCINWIPDTAPIKKKMVYSSTSQVIKSKLQGVHKYIQASDRGDLDYQAVKMQLKI